MLLIVEFDMLLFSILRGIFDNEIVIMGTENLNLGSANQLSYKALGMSFTNIVAKNSLIYLLWFNEVIKFSDKSYMI